MKLRLTPAVTLFCSFLLFISTVLMMSSAHSVPLEEEWGDWVKARHTDRGNLYTSYKYQKILKVHGMIPSMSRKGDCYDNAVAESFFASLKNEWIFYKDYRTRREAKSDIFKYIEIFYNRQRLHQTLGYQAPEQYELNAA